MNRRLNVRVEIASVCNGVNSKGVLRVIRDDYQVFACDVLELAWLDNEPQVSAIPAGDYLLREHVSPTFGECYKVYELDGSEVRGRKHILIHSANYASSYSDFKSELRGCIAPGYGYGDLDSNGVDEILNSRRAMADLRRALVGVRECLLRISRSSV